MKNAENKFSDFFFNTKQLDLVVDFPAISAYSGVIWGGVARISQFSMKINENQWKSMKINEKSMKINKNQ